MDPTLFAVAYKRNRFYLFSKREPADVETEKSFMKRDVLNEKPSKEEIQMYSQPISASLPKQVNITK
jgi:peptidylprolyl isomerase domain and WD repeat-containing protein 1